MSKDLKTLAMVDIAYELIKQSNKPMKIHELFETIAEIKEISLDDVEKLTQLYMNITQSGKFVYCGNDRWDLKEGNLEIWDTDGSQFIETLEDEEEEEFIDDFDLADLDDELEEELDDLIEDEIDEIDEQTRKELKEEKEYLEVELPLQTYEEDEEVDFDADNYDEDDYNEIMDDYEDMYE